METPEGIAAIGRDPAVLEAFYRDRIEAEAALAKHGIAADVTYLPEREECAPGRYTPVQRPLSGMRVSMGSERLRVTLPPGTVRDGETFVMAVSGETTVADGSFSGWTEFDVTAGPVGACRPRPSSVG